MRRPIWVIAALVLAAPAPALADPTPQYYTLPADLKSSSTGMTVTPDGIVYFGASDFSDTPPIGRLDPALATPGTANGITSVKTPDNPASSGFATINDVAWAPTLNALWYTRSDGVIGLLGGQAKMVDPAYAFFGLAVAGDGTAWFTEYGQSGKFNGQKGNRIASLSPSFGLTELPNFATQVAGPYDDARDSAKPRAITLDASGTPWFVEESPGLPGYRLGRVDGGAYKEVSPPCISDNPCSGSHTGEGLMDVAAAPDGSIWYADSRKRAVSRFVPGTGVITEFKLADMDSAFGAATARAIVAASDGTLWVAVRADSSLNTTANAIIRIVPGDPPGKTIYKLGTAVSPYAIATDTKGNVWFTGQTQSLGSSIGRLSGVIGAAPPPPPPSPGGGETPATQSPAPGPATTTLTPSVSAVAKVTDPTVHGTSITANQICVGPPADRCSLIFLIQTHEYIKGFPGAKDSAKPKLTTIGKATVTLQGGQSKKVTVKLNSKGRKLLKKIKKFKATLTVTESHNGAKAKQVLKKNVKFKR